MTHEITKTMPNKTLHRNSRCPSYVRGITFIWYLILRSTTAFPGCG
jgi:hypothetical protein